MLSGIVAHVDSGQLVVEGTNQADSITVSNGVHASIIRVAIAQEPTLVFNTNTQPVTRIRFEGRGGDDVFTNETSLPLTAFGGAGNDRLVGGISDDLLFGGRGNDQIWGGDGRDRIDGQDGNDMLFGGSAGDVLNGGSGMDVLRGQTGHDRLEGEGGNDILEGGVGNDRLFGGLGVDELFGDGGQDWLHGDEGSDLLSGGDGDDLLRGGIGADRLIGNTGNDSLYGQDGNDLLQGGKGNDTLNGGAGADELIGGDGNDRIYGEDGPDVLEGGAGRDVMVGGDHNDIMRGGNGDDDLRGDRGNDLLYGDQGRDTLRAGRGNDLLVGGFGIDYLNGGDGADLLYGEHETSEATADSVSILTNEDAAVWLNTNLHTDFQIGSPISLSLLSPPTIGRVHFSDTGRQTYTPDRNKFGTDGYQYLVTTSKGDQIVQNAQVTVSSVNDDPMAGPIALSVQSGGRVNVRVLAHAWDVDEDVLAASLRSSPSNGTTTQLGPGVYAYRPNEGFIGEDYFTYTISDGNGGSRVGRVNINVVGTIEDELSRPPQVTSTANHTRRPTLVVLTQGAYFAGSTTYRTYGWQIDAANQLRESLVEAGSQVFLMTVQWASMSPNTQPARELAMHIRDFLGDRQQTWDVMILGHSRGAVLNHEATRLIAEPDNLGTFQQIMLDATASVSAGDSYPVSVEGNVDRTIAYDDGYNFIPLGATSDGLRVQGAEYELAKLPGVGYYDTVYSHNRLPGWYIENRLADDIDWQLGQNPDDPSAPYIHEDFGDPDDVGDDVELLVLSRPDQGSVVDIGLEVDGGDLHGFISILGIGGADVTIGKSGLNAQVGVTFFGSAGVSITDNGLTMRISNPLSIPASAGIQIGLERTDIDANLLGLQFGVQIGGPDGGVIYFAGNELTYSSVEEYAAEKWTIVETNAHTVVTYLADQGRKLSESIKDTTGKLLEEKYWNERGDLLRKGVLSGSQWVEERFSSAGDLIDKYVYHGGFGSQLKEWKSWSTSGVLEDVEEFLSNGVKIRNKYLNSAGQWVSQHFNSAGDMIDQYIYHGGFNSQLKNWRRWDASGVTTNIEEFLSNGTKIRDKYLSSAGQWVSKHFNEAGNLINQYIYFEGIGSQLKNWKRWNANGTLTDFEEHLSNGVKSFNRYLSSSGNWVSQQLNSAGATINQWIYHNGYGSQLKQFKKWTSGGTIIAFHDYLSNGVRNRARWLNSSGNWVSQELNTAGNVVRQWFYHGGYNSQLYEYAAWNSSRALTNLNRYTTGGVRTLQAYISTTGNWVQRHYSNGVESAVRIWNSTGNYIGDQLKNFSDAASNLDPTTSDWWPF